MQETEKYPFNFNYSLENRKLIQWYLEEYLSYPYGAFRERAKNAEKSVLDLGIEMFNGVFHNKKDKDHCALRFYDRAMESPAECQITIQADHSAGWSLPWEFIHDPTYGYLAQKVGAFVRSHLGVGTHLTRLPKDKSVINILYVISRPGGDKDVLFQSIARPLLELFRPRRDRIHVDVLRPPTFGQLQKVLSEKNGFYHILHFDGHGVFPPASGIDSTIFFSDEGLQGQLVFEKEGGGKRFVSGKEFSGLISARGVPVVMLNACQSGMTDPTLLFPSVVGEIIKTGALSVVAMAYSVYVNTAVDFMARVYESLINGMTLSHSVTVAREGLATRDKRESPIGPISLQDWVVPVLFQSGEVQLFEPSDDKIHLDIGIIEDKQTEAGAEIGLPEKPLFGFIGRDTDIWKLEKAFEKESIVLLRAMAGVGKTTLAAGFARWWAETGALSGPIFFFSFESYLSPENTYNRIGEEFQEAIKAQLGIDWHILEIEQRRNIVLSILRQVRCLLIWDNFEPVEGFPKGTKSSWSDDEQQELKKFLLDLSGGATKVIITSRKDEKWLGRCYREIVLEGLTGWDSIELARKVLSRAGVDRKKLKPYNKLLEYLQGNPLAIQVILPELARKEPDDLLNALKTGEARLTKDDRKQGRQHSLTASLEYRLDQLDEKLRKRLGLLGLFQGFVWAEVLTHFCDNESTPGLLKGLDIKEWEKILEKSAEIGILQKLGTGFYKIHPALPWFFHDILQDTFTPEIEWLERRFVKVYGALTPWLQQQLESNAQIAMIQLQLEEQNMRHAIYLGCRFKMWDELLGIMYGLTERMMMQSRWSECEHIIRDILTHFTYINGKPVDKADELCGGLWHNLGMVAEERRNFAEAEEWYCKSLEIAVTLNNKHGQALTFHQLGIISEERRNFAEAKKWHHKSLKIKEKLNDKHGQAATLHQLGRIAEERGNFAEAEDWYRKSLKIKEKLNDEYGQALTFHQLGIVAQKHRRFGEAEDWYRKSLEIAVKLNNEHGQAATLHQLGRVADERRNFAEAEDWYRKSLKMKEKLKDEYGQGLTLHQLGNVSLELHNFEEAKDWYRRSLNIQEKLKDEYGQAATLHQLGRVAENCGNFAEAEDWYRRSLNIQEKLHDEYGQAATLHQLGRVAEEKGKLKEAREFFLKTEEIFKRLNDEYTLSIVQASLKRIRKNKKNK